MEENDLSHVFANSDLDAAQEHHSNLPDEAMLHFARMFAAKAGIAKHPGLYSGPRVKQPDDWVTPQDDEGERQTSQSESISNLSQDGSPDTTGPAPKASPSRPASSPDWDSLGN
jgi:hypothetical protein